MYEVRTGFWRRALVDVVIAWRWPLSIMLVATVILASTMTGSLPEPPGWVLAFAGASWLIAFPSYAVGRWTAKLLHPGPETVTVGIADPGTNDEDGRETAGEYDLVEVSPEIWAGRNVVGYPALRDPEGPADYLVTRLRWYEDISQLEIRGSEWSDMTPGEAWEHAERVDEYYDHHHVVRRKYSRLKATVAKYATEIHDATLLGEIEQMEDVELIPGVSVVDRIDEMEKSVDGLPTGPAPSSSTQEQRRRGVMGELDENLIPGEQGDDLIPDVEDAGGSPAAAATDGGSDE